MHHVLPLEYEIHRQIVNKLKVKGMNAVFGLQVSLSLRLVKWHCMWKLRTAQNSSKVVFVWKTREFVPFLYTKNTWFSVKLFNTFTLAL
jgi:hypothetical protein